jgi:hypothetical protein
MTFEQLELKAINYQDRQELFFLEADEDTLIDKHDIENELLTLSSKISKWNKRYFNAIRFLKTIETEKDKKYSSLFDLYLFDSDIKYTKSEIGIKIKGNSDYLVLVNIYYDIEGIVKFIEKTLDNLKDIKWSLKAFVEYRKINIG